MDRCIAKMVLDPLCQDLSYHAHVRGDVSAHGGLRRGELYQGALRYDRSTLDTSADILTLVQIWSSSPL